MAIAGGVALAAVLGGVVGHFALTSSTSASAPASSGTGSGSSGVGGSGSSGGFSFGGGSSGDSGNSSSGSSATGSGAPSNTAAIAKAVDPGLVDINTVIDAQDEEAAGTGMVLTSNGEVLTNNHVIDEASKISVTDVGNGKTYSASVVGYDKTQDVAVLQLTGASGLQTVTTGSSSSVSKGEGVVGVGNAGGTGGTPSYAGGSVTALDQSITASDEGDGTSETLKGLIESNANIEPGDSGGPLVSADGKVVGMDTAASDGLEFEGEGSSTSEGFSIPINEALGIAKAIEAGTTTSVIHIGSTAFLGVEVASTSEGCDDSSSGGLGTYGGSSGSGSLPGVGGSSGSSSGSSTSGALICETISGDAAANAGLEGGDTITAVNGKTVSSSNDLTEIMIGEKPDDTIQVTYTDSSGQSHTVSVQLQSGPPQ